MSQAHADDVRGDLVGKLRPGEILVAKTEAGVRPRLFRSVQSPSFLRRDPRTSS